MSPEILATSGLQLPGVLQKSQGSGRSLPTEQTLFKFVADRDAAERSKGEYIADLKKRDCDGMGYSAAKNASDTSQTVLLNVRNDGGNERIVNSDDGNHEMKFGRSRHAEFPRKLTTGTLHSRQGAVRDPSRLWSLQAAVSALIRSKQLPNIMGQISHGCESAVLTHELVRKHGLQVLGKEGGGAACMMAWHGMAWDGSIGAC
jgi:hypothetical protein